MNDVLFCLRERERGRVREGSGASKFRETSTGIDPNEIQTHSLTFFFFFRLFPRLTSFFFSSRIYIYIYIIYFSPLNIPFHSLFQLVLKTRFVHSPLNPSWFDRRHHHHHHYSRHICQLPSNCRLSLPHIFLPRLILPSAVRLPLPQDIPLLLLPRCALLPLAQILPRLAPF
jgi:hypothetical protein